MYLKYIDDKKIDTFVKKNFCPNARSIIVPDCEERHYINVYTNLLSTTLHITDFECINLETGKIYSNVWRKYMIKQLDSISNDLGNQYIDNLHDFLEQDTICGPVL